MTADIDRIFWENSRRYGSRRVLEALKGQLVKAGRHRVRRMMQEQGWLQFNPVVSCRKLPILDIG